MKITAISLFIAALVLTGCQNISKQDLEALQAKAASYEEQSQQLQAENGQLKQTVDALKQRLAEEIEANQVLVEQSAQGDIKVTMQQAILFPSASFKIDDAGYAVLQKVADSLRNLNSDQHIQVIGHSDTMPVHAKWRDMFTDNWDLSARRAGQVARHLIWGQGFAPEMISVVGKAHTVPVASNDTEEGRAQNRRIEIFIEK
ncbi:MAG: hypothetical protein AUK35_10865 [Zetaproteobacteria bacterium CG2_30_46_52]|nr:MAG: hypothetical protein AUK35_10865 [Zetaproteobacteria bacterium CG2_30_46_52]